MSGTREPAGVDIDGVDLSYGDHPVLRGITLTIMPGEFFALLGPSGSGKSTLLRLIAGFNAAQRGVVRIGGRDVAQLPPWKRGVGMVFQNYALWPHLSVAQNVAFGLEENRWPRERVRERVREMLALVGLTDYASRRPGQLSGGQQQRVAIARTLAIEPSVLLLDEPLSNLDAKLRASTGLEMKRLQQRLRLTTLFVTHDQQEAMTIADRLAVLDQGVIQQVGSPREVYDAPANRFVAEFVGSINLVPPDTLRVNAGVFDMTSTLAFRPHAVRLLDGSVDPQAFVFDAEVVTAQFIGEFVRYELAAGATRIIADLPHLRGEPTLPPASRHGFVVARSEVIAIAR